MSDPKSVSLLHLGGARHLLDALYNLRRSTALREALGETFVSVFLEVKLAEHEAYQQVISAWEREHLLLNV